MSHPTESPKSDRHPSRLIGLALLGAEVVTKRSQNKWVTLDRFAMGPETKWFPVWQKFAPAGIRPGK